MRLKDCGVYSLMLWDCGLRKCNSYALRTVAKLLKKGKKYQGLVIQSCNFASHCKVQAFASVEGVNLWKNASVFKNIENMELKVRMM